ncbi:MAG: pitrilysin family protein, partial [Anaerolineales bacterium]
LEHVLLSGSSNQAILDIHSRVDHLGGEINAQTGKDYIGVHCVLPRKDWLTGLEILADVLSHPRWDEQALEREKKVILEEIRRARDQSRAILALFAATIWENHPLSNPILGLPEHILLAGIEHLQQMYTRHFTAPNMAIAVCGDLDHDEVLRQVAGRFENLSRGPELPRFSAYCPNVSEPLHTHLQRETGQVMMMLGVPTVSMNHSDRTSIKLLERMLGMGLGGRLYRRLRVEQQVVYSVTTAAANYEDTGYLAAQTICHPKNVYRVRDVILDEFERLSHFDVSPEELNNAKLNYAGNLLRHFETNLAIANIAAIESLLSRLEPFPESLERIQSVTLDDINRVAQHYLTSQTYVLATLGASIEHETV